MTESIVEFRLIVEKPVVGAVYGVQQGSGSKYETLQKQTAGSAALIFNIALPAKRNKEGNLVLYGPLCQGPPHERFIYLELGAMPARKTLLSADALKFLFSICLTSLVAKL
ncbi:hypothetical protein J2I46_06620 [Fibrella sp. HMF5405]|uniref:Uncharacterized protein n=1 Tax=Fibrella forsythiae TaxID=2817061 RepID=A0ABS3JE12_9BACT|nr:DUF5990 family protein [Fibrella forsythiae]MBO0948246.1 hypothetical protein [Fibrella forsythiae]